MKKLVKDLKEFISCQIEDFDQLLEIGQLNDKKYIDFQNNVRNRMQQLLKPEAYEEVRQYMVEKDKAFYERATKKFPKNTIATIYLPAA